MAIEPASPGAFPGAGHASSDDEALHRASLALNAHRPQDAERIAREILRAKPAHLRALQILGYALLAQDRGAEAIAPLEAAARNKHDPETDTALAAALRQAGRFDEAVSRLKRTVKRHPQFAPGFRELGSLLFGLERFDEAVEALKRGLDVAPMMPDLSVQLGLVLLHRRDCAGAKASFTRALAIAPNAAEALFGLAKAHQELGENEAAAAHLRRFLMLQPGDANAWLTLGHCLLELGDRDGGYDCFRTVARSHPKHRGDVLRAFVTSGRGRFWLRPSAAVRFLSGKKN
jgi:tetratricopeptide (TPR) repeat protein